MNNFFYPAISISNNLSFKAKFIAVSLLCLLPLLFFAYILISNAQQKIDNANYEYDASGYIVPLRNLAEHIAQTRGMTNVYLNGNKKIANKIANKRQQVEQDFKLLLTIDNDLGKNFQTQGTPQQLQNKWQAITADAYQGEATNIFQQYTHLITEVLNFMDTIGRQGRMLQDSNADNSYLISSLLHTIPNQVESLGQLRGKGAGIIAANKLTTDNKLLITSLAQTQNAKKLAKDMEYLFKSNQKIEQHLNNRYKEAKQLLSDYLILADQQIISAEQPTMKANEFFTRGTETITALLTLFDTIQPLLKTRMQQQIASAENTIYFLISLISIVSFLLVYSYIGIYLAIKNNLIAMMHSANEISEGNLCAKLNLATKDELQLISTGTNEIVDGMTRSISAINNSSDEIAITSDEIAQESNNAAQGMIVQSQELEQVSTAITEMSASINEVAQNTELGANSAQNAAIKATDGSQAVQQTISSINLLATNIEQAADGVNTLKENSNNITNILDVIKGIADQTNLLALNAAIEAARAGEQGRGFAVVADEVRTLAQRTQDSTLEIQSMIELIQNGIEGVATSMTESQHCATTAVECSEQAGEVITEINTSVKEITDMSSQIAAAVEEQSVVSEEVAKSIVNISDVANDSARGARVLAQAGARLSAMSKEMRIIIQHYQIDQAALGKEDKTHLLQWQNKFNLGIDEADRQHKKMLSMMNGVHVMSVNHCSNKAIAKALDALITYTEVHFAWEEELFTSYDYPQSELHHNTHVKLVQDLRQHQANIATSNNTQIRNELVALNEWLLNHIEHSDKDYVAHIKAQGFIDRQQKLAKIA